MYEEMMAFVKQTLVERDPRLKGLDSRFPFRNRFDHSFRVYHWALRIQANEGGDHEIVSIAAIFHDVAKGTEGNRPHAEVGAEICDEYLRSINYPDERRKRVCQAIRYHSSKRHHASKELALEDKIIMDADMLDEVGALTILWDSMATAQEKEPSYEKVFQRTSHYYTRLKKETPYFLTSTGRRFFEEKLGFLEFFLKNLEQELGL